MTAVAPLIIALNAQIWLANAPTLRPCLCVPPRKVLRRLHLAGFHLLHQGGEPRRRRHRSPSPARRVIRRELASYVRLCAPSSDLLTACFAPVEHNAARRSEFEAAYASEEVRVGVECGCEIAIRKRKQEFKKQKNRKRRTNEQH